MQFVDSLHFGPFCRDDLWAPNNKMISLMSRTKISENLPMGSDSWWG